jgi:hypothetical protein
MTLVRWIQLAVSIAGLIFSSSSKQIHGFLVFAFVLALVYEIILIVSSSLSKEIFTGRGQTIAEIVLAIVVLVATIYVTVSGMGDAMNILAIICGFVLPALFVMTAYNGQ